ncbi:MAG: PDZ domain-containing protein [Firmicutes bacterium]|nr:PDZ domain-containing protein [Bacillota bacterium]
MKKLILLLTILFLPLNADAYSEYVIPGGNTLGIEVETDGVMIIGFYKIDGKYNRGKPALQGGDYITKVNGNNINTVEEMTKAIENAEDKRSVEIVFRRGKDEKKTELSLVLSEGKYKTGLYVKSSIKGIGTLSYIDPKTMIFGALGHEINESETNSIVEIKSGIIFENTITGIQKSKPGVPGSKLASFNYANEYGKIYKNSKYGVFGKYEAELPNVQLLEVGDEVQIGPAYIKTVLDGQEILDYEIEITSINETSSTKNIVLKILDESLLEITGGVVQGMSGSPIIQNGRIIGVLTHVIVDNPITGYGLFITKMLEEGEK